METAEAPPTPKHRELYPALAPHDVFRIDVGHGHRLYVEVSGNPAGRPVVVLHGGPGAGCLPDHRRFFDSQAYRIVILDQRGAGRSTPRGSVEHNTTPDLIDDLELVRERLGIDRWILFGGSWGSTLALAYTAAHPSRAAAMVLRGSWLAREEDVDWHMLGLRALAPDRWLDFVAPVPEGERGNLLEAYWTRLSSSDPRVQAEAARAWCAFEAHFTRLFPPGDAAPRPDDEQLALARIEAHYFRNRCFLEPSRLLEGIARIGGTPGAIVHGRYDWLARLEAAWMIAEAWPAAELDIVPHAAHSVFEPGIQASLVAATDRLARIAPWS